MLGWGLGRGSQRAEVCLGSRPAPTAPTLPAIELESQTDHLFPANASAPSGEHVRRTLAEVERLLGEMRARDLGAPRTAAEAELGVAQRCEWLRSG